MQQPPSAERWDDLCALLDEEDHPGRFSEASAYALAHLTRWPDALRRLPGRWLDRALKRDDLRGLELVRVIELEPSVGRLGALIERLESLGQPPKLHTLGCAHHALSPSIIERLDAHPSLSCIKALRVESAHLPMPDDEIVAALGRCANLRLQELTLDGVRSDGESWRALAMAPAFRGLARLSLSGTNIKDHALERLLRGENARKLRALDLSETAISAQTLAQCLDSQALPRLSELKLWGLIGAEGDALARAIAQTRHASLHRLNLEATGLSDEGLALLLEDERWTQGLVELELGHNELGPQSLETLLKSPLHQLHRLTLNDTAVNHEDRWSSAREGSLSALTAINIERTDLGARGLQGILRAAPKLETLRLGQNPLTDEGLASLGAHTTSIKRLGVAYARLTTEALKRELGAGALGALEELDLSHNGLDDGLIQAFIAGAGAQLEQLNLSYNQLSSEALVGLALSHIPHLTSLELTGNPIHDHGVIAFVSSKSARRLKRLRFGPRRWSLAAVHAISASKQLGRLEALDLELGQLTLEQRQRLAQAPHLPPCW